MELMRRYQALKEKVTERKEEFAELMMFIEKDTAYMTTPASTKYHLCRERGLLEHTGLIQTITFSKGTTRDYIAIPASKKHCDMFKAAFDDMRENMWGKLGVCR